MFKKKPELPYYERKPVTYKEVSASAPKPRSEPIILAKAPPIPIPFSVPPTPGVVKTVSFNMNEVDVIKPAPPVLLSEPVSEGNTNFAPEVATFPSLGESYFVTASQVTADVEKWSLYQAIENVNMGGFKLNNVSYLNAQYVDVGTVTLSETDNKLLYNGKQVATTNDVANWAQNSAVSTINMSGNSIIGLNQINGVAYPPPIPSTISAKDLTVSTLTALEYVNTPAIRNLSSINGLPFPAVDLTLSTITMNPLGLINFSTLGGSNAGRLTGISTINGVPFGAVGVATLNGLDGALTLAQGTGITLNTDGGTKTITINATTPGVSNTITGQNTFMTATGGTLASANANITAGGGTGGNITATASAGDLGVSGGNISLTANGGTGLGGLYGVVNLTANPGTDLLTDIATGGAINILANSPTVGLTSKVSITGGGVNIYSGVFTPIASEFGYTFINASLGISLVAGGFTSAFQSPGTVYLYGAQGIILDNGVYATDIQPKWDGNPLVPPAPLTIHGRTAGGSNVPVILNNVETLSMQGSGAISGVNSINGSAYPPPAPSIPPNLNLSTLTIGPAGTISFTDITGPLNTGYILGLDGGDLTVDASPSNATFVKGGYTTDATPPGAIQYNTLNQVRINPLQNTPAITAQAGILIGQEGVTMTFPTAVGTTTGCGKIENLSTINGLNIASFSGVTSLNTLTGALDLRSPTGSIDIGDDVDHINLDIATSISLTTLTMNTGGSIGFTSGDGVMTGISTLNAITLTDHDIGNVGQLQVQDGFTLDGAGTITLNGSSGSPGQVIGIPVDGSYPQWVDAGGGGSYPANANFSTITMGTGGSIDFSDATGFIRTSAIYGRAGDALNLTASLDQGISLLAGNANITVDGRANIIASTGLSEAPYCGYVFNSDGTANISQTLVSGGGAISLDADGNIHVTATGEDPDPIPSTGLFITANAMYFNGVLVAGGPPPL